MNWGCEGGRRRGEVDWERPMPGAIGELMFETNARLRGRTFVLKGFSSLPFCQWRHEWHSIFLSVRSSVVTERYRISALVDSNRFLTQSCTQKQFARSSFPTKTRCHAGRARKGFSLVDFSGEEKKIRLRFLPPMSLRCHSTERHTPWCLSVDSQLPRNEEEATACISHFLRVLGLWRSDPSLAISKQARHQSTRSK
jgi:hypothetical protein